MAQHSISFLLNDERKTLTQYDPTMTVLDYLRNNERKTGTKEGCASGDCGACTVVLRDNEGNYQTINSCISPLPTLHGKQLITVEDLKAGDELHGTQASMVKHDGTQCGFCTPGFVMSAFALHKNEKNPNKHQVMEALAGNLCRCTGYRSIIDAALEVPTEDHFDRNDAQTLENLKAISRDSVEWAGDQGQCFMPNNLAELAELVKSHPDARLLAGGTDFGLEITQFLKTIETIIYVGNVAELKTVAESDAWLDVGAAVTYTEVLPKLRSFYPDFGDMIDRLGSLQIRNQGTIGGNVGNASPIGDTPPVLIALGAKLVLRSGEQQREIAIADYFKNYKVTDLQPGEFIERILIPKPKTDKTLKVYKISKRLDDDISAVLAAFHIKIENGTVVEFDSGFGGMAAIPKHATNCEQAMRGKPWSQETINQAMTALALDFNPLTDARASKEYRLTVAQNLLQKCFYETEDANNLSRVTFYDAAAAAEVSHA